jgi:hypothetical protein
MSVAVKIILTVIAVALLALLGLYVWGVAATTPPKGPDNPVQEGIVKQAVAEGPQPVYFGIGWSGEDTARVYTVAVGSPTDDMGGADILRVSGKPVPVDVKAPARGRVEIVFDGKLADGTDTLSIAIGDDYRAAKIVEVENGAVKD